jgi:hypothetical protein
VKDGKNATDPSSIRADFDTLIHNLLTLGEDVLVSWASQNLDSPEMMQIHIIPEERRDPQNPPKYTVGPGAARGACKASGRLIVRALHRRSMAQGVLTGRPLERLGRATYSGDSIAA